MTRSDFDVIVIGAGIVGVACAEACAVEGLRVAVVERRGIAVGATGAAMGHIVVPGDGDENFALARLSHGCGGSEPPNFLPR